MGVSEEDSIPEHKSMMDKEKTDCPIYLPNKPMPSFQKNKAVFLLIAALILLIIGFSATLIIVCTSKITEISNQKSAPCEDDWIWHRGKCYYFSTERDTWNNSQKFCNSHNSSLAIIDNKEELDFLFRFKCTDNHWIGIRRTDDNTAWTWTNGTLYKENLFTITRLSENSGEIEYVFLNHDGVRSQEGPYEYKRICSKT